MFKLGSGWLMHVSSLPGLHGIGDLGPQIVAFLDKLSSAGGKYWQLLPLNPGNPESGESPYFSASAFAANPMFISLELLAEEGFLTKADVEAKFDPQPGRVLFEQVRSFKFPLLEKAFICAGKKQEHQAEFQHFVHYEDWWLRDYALFEAIKAEQGGRTWASWPDDLKYRNPQSIDRIRSVLHKQIDFVMWLQFIVASQWTQVREYAHKKGITVIGDIPIYVSYESADVWTHPEMFKLDDNLLPTAVSGVPPDYFSTTGQLWNNPVYQWEYLEKSGFAWWRKRMQATFNRYDIVRIDHFRGLVKYWEVPAHETTAINGSWKPVPTETLFSAIMTGMDSFPVIAEDLGIITPDVTAIKEHYQFPGMKILQFAFGTDDPNHLYLPHAWEENCVAYTGTHDNNTTLAWIENSPQEERARIYAYLGKKCSNEEAVWGLISKGLESKASIVIIPVQDLLMLGSEARMNNPAQVSGNWHWRISKDDFSRIPTESFYSICKKTGR